MSIYDSKKKYGKQTPPLTNHITVCLLSRHVHCTWSIKDIVLTLSLTISVAPYLIENHMHTKFSQYLDESLQVHLQAEISCQLRSAYNSEVYNRSDEEKCCLLINSSYFECSLSHLLVSYLIEGDLLSGMRDLYHPLPLILYNPLMKYRPSQSSFG